MRVGVKVRIEEGYRKTDLVGIPGTVRNYRGYPEYAAVDVVLEDGRSELLWFHELEVVEDSDVASKAPRFLRK